MVNDCGRLGEEGEVDVADVRMRSRPLNEVLYVLFEGVEPLEAVRRRKPAKVLRNGEERSHPSHLLGGSGNGQGAREDEVEDMGEEFVWERVEGGLGEERGCGRGRRRGSACRLCKADACEQGSGGQSEDRRRTFMLARRLSVPLFLLARSSISRDGVGRFEPVGKRGGSQGVERGLKVRKSSSLNHLEP